MRATATRHTYMNVCTGVLHVSACVCGENPFERACQCNVHFELMKRKPLKFILTHLQLSVKTTEVSILQLYELHSKSRFAARKCSSQWVDAATVAPLSLLPQPPPPSLVGPWKNSIT